MQEFETNEESRLPDDDVHTTSMTVLIASHNRAEALNQTLLDMSKLHTVGLDVEWVVVDNNSTDETPDIVRRHRNQLPVRLLSEPRAGKNIALNHALANVDLGEIVVLTDDDVSPDRNWLQAISNGCKQWKDISVFGGKIIPRWPIDPPPWVRFSGIADFGYSAHDLGSSGRLYPPEMRPYGPNMWVRREIFEAGHRFPEYVGPRPKDRIMGSETVFLISLAEAGFDAAYIPDAVVEHRIEERTLSTEWIVTRAFGCGRGMVHGHHQNGSLLRELAQLPWLTAQGISTIGRLDDPNMVARRVFVNSRLGVLYERCRQLR